MAATGSTSYQVGSRLFDFLDGKGDVKDNKLSWAEFVPLCQQIGWNPDAAQMLWFQTDTDRNGTLSKPEFLSFSARPDVQPYVKQLEDNVCTK